MDKTTLIQTKLQLESKIRSSANWFYWIAGLSLINTVILLSGGDINFIFGLGVTQLIDGFAYVFAPDFGNYLIYIAVALDVFIACMFILIGKFAGKRKKGAFITGIILYVLDGAIFLLWSDILSIGFHAFALYSIYTGMPAIKKLAEVEGQLQEAIEQENNIADYQIADTVEVEEAVEETELTEEEIEETDESKQENKEI